MLAAVHISGQGDHDNAMKIIPPGSKLTYVYVIAPNFQGGTHWYHPHFHGKVAHQVIGGGRGPLFLSHSWGW